MITQLSGLLAQLVFLLPAAAAAAAAAAACSATVAEADEEARSRRAGRFDAATRSFPPLDV